MIATAGARHSAAEPWTPPGSRWLLPRAPADLPDRRNLRERHNLPISQDVSPPAAEGSRLTAPDSERADGEKSVTSMLLGIALQDKLARRPTDAYAAGSSSATVTTREPERLIEIGERLGLSLERVRQIEQRALTKMRHAD